MGLRSAIAVACALPGAVVVAIWLHRRSKGSDFERGRTLRTVPISMRDSAIKSLVETPRAPMNRREGLKRGAASLMTSLLPMPSLVAAQTESPPKEKAMADNTAIRPFHFEAHKQSLRICAAV